jgi:hypothetical protein
MPQWLVTLIIVVIVCITGIIALNILSDGGAFN